jgi:hypothetical protein
MHNAQATTVSATSLEELDIGGNKIFHNLSKARRMRLKKLPTAIEKSGNDLLEVIQIIRQFREFEKCAEFMMFISLAEWVSVYVNEAVFDLRADYQYSLDKGLKISSDVPVDDVSRHSYFQTNVRRNILGPDGARDMIMAFNIMKTSVTKEHAKCSTRFMDDYAATYHYYKHRQIGSYELTVREYFQLMDRLAKEAVKAAGGMPNTRTPLVDRITAYGETVTIVLKMRPCGNVEVSTLYAGESSPVLRAFTADGTTIL